jgi:radical SAM protein with 4Fe4S-binding SPASM domain
VRRLHPYYALARRAAEANVRRLDFPFKLTFCLTFWCNYRCQTCNIWKMKPRDELRLDEIQRFFQRSPGFLWVDLTGGEVTLRKDFPEICEAVIDNCPDLLLLHFPTNGYLTDKVVDAVRAVTTRRSRRRGPEKLIVTVSTDGDEAMNDAIRGIEGGWRRQLETFRALRAMPGVDVVLGMTLSAANVDHFPDAFAAARREVPDLRADEFHVNIVHESPHYLGNTDLGLRRGVDREKLASAIEQYAQVRGRSASPVGYLERAYLSRVRRFLETGRTPMRCHALSASCFIDSWGNVFPCTIYDRKIGSLREVDYDLARLWNTPEADQLEREIWEYNCPQCWTPCEAYQSIMGNFVTRGWRPGRDPVVAPTPQAAPARRAENTK